MTFGALGGFLRTPKNPPGYGPEMVPFANKIVVIGYTARPCTARTRPCTYSCSCTRAIYTAVYTSRGVYGTYTAVHTVHGLTRPLHGPYTARSRPRNGRVHVHTCTRNTAITRPCTRRVHGPKRPCARPSTRPVNSRAHRPCARPVHGRVHLRVHGPYTQPRTHGLSCIRHVHDRVHGPTRPLHDPYTARSRPLDNRVHVYTCTRAVYTAITRPCTRPVHGGKRRVHGPSSKRHVHGRVHGLTRPIHGRVHGPFTAV